MSLLQATYHWLTPSIISILIIFIILCKYIKRLLICPISHLPGPFYTSLSHLPIIYQDWIPSNRTKWTLQLHEKYGTIVRLSPSEVSISSPEFIREVFVSSKGGGGGYPKAPIFNIFQHFDARNAFSSIESEDHSWRRKLVGGLYTQSAVLRKEAAKGRLWALVGDCLDGVEREGVDVGLHYSSDEGERMGMGKAIDLSSFCTYYGTDGVTSHIFPPGSSSSSLRGTKSHRSFIEASRESPDEVITYFKMEYEGLESIYITLRNLARRVGQQVGLCTEVKETPIGRTRLNTKGTGKKENFSPGDKLYGGSEIEDWGYRRFLETKNKVEELGISEDVVAETLAQSVIEGDQKVGTHGHMELPIGDDRGLRLFQGQDKKYYRDDGAASECMDQFLAGRDTTGDSLSYTIYMLSLPTNTSIQSSLHSEIQSLNLPNSHSQPLTQDQLTASMKAPYLDAVIKETLRIFPASTTSLQRSVPAGGRTINSFFIPEGTVIGATPMSTNTSPIFASPSVSGMQEIQDINSWIPERWIPSISSIQENMGKETERITEMERRLWTFGSGGRGCIGKHFAMLEMRLLLAGVYGRYRTEIDDTGKVLITHDDWSRRTTFRDIPFFPQFKGVVTFVAI